MHELEAPPSALDPSNCINIALAKPGEDIRVIVRVDDNPTAMKLMDAVGALSNDGRSFSIMVTREDGTQQTHDLCYPKGNDPPAFVGRRGLFEDSHA